MGYGLLSCLGARGKGQGARGLFYFRLYTLKLPLNSTLLMFNGQCSMVNEQSSTH